MIVLKIILLKLSFRFLSFFEHVFPATLYFLFAYLIDFNIGTAFYAISINFFKLNMKGTKN